MFSTSFFCVDFPRFSDNAPVFVCHSGRIPSVDGLFEWHTQSEPFRGFLQENITCSKTVDIVWIGPNMSQHFKKGEINALETCQNQTI